jgi:hypothetical protein
LNFVFEANRSVASNQARYALASASRSGSGRGGGGWFLFRRGFFAFEVSVAAMAFLNFVGLYSHNSLVCA